jgi:geranylgeranyl diphosphate synthase type I
MAVDPIASISPTLLEPRDRIEGVLRAFLRQMRNEMALVAPHALLPIDEVIRLVEAGGRRLRPAFCYWGYRAAGGGEEEAIARAAAAMELLHTMALIHDDLMDAAPERRGVQSSAEHLAIEARERGAPDPEDTGRSLAILSGDLAAVLADQALLTAGFDADVLLVALDRYHRMRTDMALGQCLDLLDTEPPGSPSVAMLKGGSYTVGGPLTIGAALAGAGPASLDALAAYARPLGLAFQLRDDERDGDLAPVPGRVPSLVADAKAALHGSALDPAAAEALRMLADLVEVS